MTTPPSVLAAIERYMAEVHPGLEFSIQRRQHPGWPDTWVVVDEDGRRINPSEWIE